MLSIDDLRNAGVTTHELHRGGFTIDQMQSAGLTISQIHAGGVSTAQLKDAGITITQMRNAGLTVSQIHAGGVSIADLLEEDDLTLIKLRTGGVPDYALFKRGLQHTAAINRHSTCPHDYDNQPHRCEYGKWS